MKKYYKCIKCHKIYPFKKGILTCENHSKYYGYLTLIYDYKNIIFPNNSFNSWEKYKDLLPINDFDVSFNEQKTPLIKLVKLGKKYGFHNLFVKDESKNPTGSFKDKESMCAINKAIEWGIKNIFVVSSGNAAVSTAAYAQKAGIKCTCLVAKNLSVGKRFLISLYGGVLKEYEGTYEDIFREAIGSSFPEWNCTPGINPIKEEGIKIIGYEIWEDIRVPDVVVVPCGNGTLLFGIYKAFKELLFMGLIDKMPKMIGVQIEKASPLKSAFEQGKEYIVLGETPMSIAEGIVAQESYSSPKVMLALSDTGGGIIEVEEDDIKAALKEVIEYESMVPEPTSAVVYAALKQLSMYKDCKVVLVQSAGGMKNLKEIMQTIIGV